MPIIDIKDAYIYIVDGTTATPNSLEVKVGEGNLTYSERYNVEYRRNRGRIGSGADVRAGDEEPCEVSLDLVWEFLRSVSGGDVTPEEALKRVGSASDWKSTGSDPCAPYAVDLVVEYRPSCSGGDGTLNERITFSEFRLEQLDHDLRAGTLSAQGKCNEVAPTIIRTASDYA